MPLPPRRSSGLSSSGVSAGRKERSSTRDQILLLLSCLSCLYVAGRLWLDARSRREIVALAQNSLNKDASVSIEDSFRIANYKEQEKRMAVLEMELATAKLKGFMSDIDSRVSNSSSRKGRMLAVIGINTGFGQKSRRDSIRSTWMPTGEKLRKLEEERGVVFRFVIGRSANKGDISDQKIDDEHKITNDFLILQDHVEAYDELPKKTKRYFATAVNSWNADFYMKVDDDVYVSMDRLLALLEHHRGKSKVYLGCMKSGEVYSLPSQRWHEPEWWKFGDAKTYFRHATGQIYALSRALAVYVALNRNLLHEYRNEDVSLGSWMLGLDAMYVDERRLCCASPPNEECSSREKEGNGCVAVFDWQCSGLCRSADRMATVQSACG